MKKLPLILIYSRIVIGALIIALCIKQPFHFRGIIIGLIITGLLTDVFDGIVARHLKVSTQKLRRLDSSVDVVFWITVIIGCWLIGHTFFITNSIKIIILIVAEGACYVLCFIKFKKEVATHALSSKLWALTLLMTLIEVVATGTSLIMFNICFYVGLFSRLEIIGMLLVIKNWTNDIPTLYHAFSIRKGKPIKRYKLFNG